jgi:large subunit ribosomal protein L4
VTTIDVLDAAGNKSGSVELPAELFDAQVNIPLMHQVVVGQLAAARQGTHDTLSRGEVSGGGRKPYRQKGTGRARQGSTRAPQFTGGGVVHGPKPHKYDQRTPKKMKAAALRGALSDRARDGRLHLVEGFVEGDRPSTRTALEVLQRLSERPRVLVVVERRDTVTRLSLRNVARIRVLPVDQLNTYDVLASDDVVFTRGAYDDFVASRATGGAPAVPTEATDDVLAEVVSAVVDDVTAERLATSSEEIVAAADDALTTEEGATTDQAPRDETAPATDESSPATDDSGADQASAQAAVAQQSPDDDEAARPGEAVEPDAMEGTDR